MTERELNELRACLEAAEAGDVRLVVAILVELEESSHGPVVDDTRCRTCGRWAGQRWSYPNVRYCAQLERAAA